MEKLLALIHGDSEMYLSSMERDEKGEVYVYSPYNFPTRQCFYGTKRRNNLFRI